MDGDGQQLDLRGLKCPQPVLRARKALRRLAPGRSLVLQCTDPLSAIDIPHLARQCGYDLLQAERQDTVWLFRIRKPL